MDETLEAFVAIQAVIFGLAGSIIWLFLVVGLCHYPEFRTTETIIAFLLLSAFLVIDITWFFDMWPA